ncbi:P-loop containing nucleoside triphosphate hydrolase protein [Mycena belliarum]|uniref:DNA 3'-5' helicase n=1 Tax=Mycena belliarum TaxID=1033014 RepID=A0AAD6U7V5_9AGAR|nr:P-loop containing nucleoside triphosphate hydrolase protein [Mycena belliae]
MPFAPVATLDPERLKTATQNLCDVFGIPALHPHQEETGQNILRGITTLLDVPTGGGKTIAFWYALFYHWQPGNTDAACQKIVLVVGPLVALMESQAKKLREKGVPAAAITSRSPNVDQLMTDLGQNKFRVGLVGPEMALSTDFHSKVLNQVPFTKNVICLVIDELHCICEWGGDDFRPEYRDLVKLAIRLPTGLPILGATATAPYHVIKDILENLGLPADCARVQVSNEKLNVSLAVRILQHEPGSFADLLILFPENPEAASDFPQTLIYANGRMDAEKAQDFLRDNAPNTIDGTEAFEFYHRHIEEARKDLIQERIANGALRGVPATDALGLGMDFQAIMRVILWMMARTFLSHVQKIGRCVRDPAQRGQAVLYITKAMYTRCCVELELLETEKDKDGSEASDDEEQDIEQPPDRETAMERDAESSEESDEEVLVAPAKRRRKGKAKKASPMELRDRRYYLQYITTTSCRRIPWNKFFGNKDKKRLAVLVPDGPCCDNCNPDAFEVETIVLVGGHQIKAGRKEKSSPEVEDAVRERLTALREEILGAEFPNQHFLTGNVLISNDVVDTLAKRARLVTSIETLLQQTYWIYAQKYGPKVVPAIQEVLVQFPDLAKEARETQAAERAERTLSAAAFKELRSRLLLVFNGCYDAVYSELEARAVEPSTTGRKRKKPLEPRRRCQLFLRLPNRNVFPDYYELIKEPISMKNIQKLSQKATHYTGLTEYRNAWHLMFDNARQYNIDGSVVYEDAEYLQKVFDRNLYMLSTLHTIPGHEQLPAFPHALAAERRLRLQ